MLLSEVVEQFIAQNPRVRDSRTVDHYRSTITKLSRFLGRSATLDDMTNETVYSFLTNITQGGLAPATANHRRKNLVSLWNWLAKRRLVDRFPDVPKIPEPKRIPRAWTEEQIRRLVDACSTLPGTINGYCPASDWWLAFHGVAWDTGARTSEILALRWTWLDKESGVLHVPGEARKGGLSDAVYQLMPDTLEAVLRLDLGARTIFHGIGHRTAFWKRYATILKRAGLPVDRTNHPQKLRRSHASWLKRSGGDPTASLGHSSDAVTRASYLDPSVCSPPHSISLFRILPAQQAAGTDQPVQQSEADRGEE